MSSCQVNQGPFQPLSEVRVGREKVRDRRRLLEFADSFEVVADHEGRIQFGEEGVHDGDVGNQDPHVLHVARLGACIIHVTQLAAKANNMTQEQQDSRRSVDRTGTMQCQQGKFRRDLSSGIRNADGDLFSEENFRREI